MPSFSQHPGPYHVFLVPHSHLDVEWYWAYDKSRAWSRRIFRDALALLEGDSVESFTQDQAPLTSLIAEEADGDRLRVLHDEGRFEVVGGYVQPELAEPHGESLIRQLLLGRKRTRELFGMTPEIGWFIDSFGQAPQVGQILAGCGMRGYVFMRGVPARLGEQPSAFRYRSPDGTEILALWLSSAYTTEHPYLEQSFLTEIEHASCPYVTVMWGSDVTNPGAMPARAGRDAVLELARKHGVPVESVTIATPGAVFDALDAIREELPVVAEDFSPAHDRFADLRGTYSNRVPLKLANRLCEQTLLSAEAWDALADAVAGSPADASAPRLSLAWERVLYNHFHDIMGGSCTDEVFTKAMKRFGTALDLSEDVRDESLDAIISQVDTTGLQHPVAVFNSLSHARTELVEFEHVFRDGFEQIRVVDADGQAVPCYVWPDRVRRDGRGRIVSCHVSWLAEDVAPFGYAMYGVAEALPGEAPGIEDSGLSIENEWLRVEVDPASGDVASITDTSGGRSVLGGPGNEILMRGEDDPDLEGCVRINGKVDRSSQWRCVGVRRLRTDPFESITTETDTPFGRLTRAVTLTKGVRRIDFETRIERFTGSDVLVTTRFPLAVAREARYTYETPSCMTERDTEYHCAQSMVLLSDGAHGAGLVNTGSAGYWPQDGGLELILFRSVANYQGYYSPLAAEHGDHVHRYSLVPFSGDWRDSDVLRQAHSVNRPLVARFTDNHDGSMGTRGSLLSAEPANVAVGAVKRADVGDGLVVRLWETTGRATTARLACGLPVRTARKATLEEASGEELPVRDGVVEVELRGFEIATVILG